MKLKTHAAILGLFVTSTVAEKGCEKSRPQWSGKYYVTNEIHGGLIRLQNNEIIKANSVEFGGFICVRKKSFDCFFETYIVNCKEYGKQSACGLEIND